MGWLSAKCPINVEEQAWIDDQFRWFADQFGRSWLTTPIVLPTDDFFPGAYTGSEDDVRRAVVRVCGYMEVDPERICLDFHGEIPASELAPDSTGAWSTSGIAGHYRTVNGKAYISLDEALARTPLALIATIAHELAHERLLGEERIQPDRTDQEPLTDLLTVYLGLGVFTANAALEFTHVADGRYSRWSSNRLGYLTEPMFGYAFARYAWMRGEPTPNWASYVDPNPRSLLNKGLRFLQQSTTDTRVPQIND